MKLRNKISLFFILPLLSGLMFWLAWPPLHVTFLVFAAFLPLLIAEKLITETYSKRTGLKAWLSLLTGLMIWNVLTTWWVANASLGGGIFANLLNALLMTIPFMLSRFTRKQFGNRLGYVSLVFYWMAFEFIHLRWEFTWPWLSVGNVFALNHTWIQWYEFTGVFGGTLWVWITNLLIFYLLYNKIFSAEKNATNSVPLIKKYLPHLILLFIIVIPILISKNIYSHYQEKGKPVNITVLQPNYEAKYAKFDVPYKIQMKKMMDLSSEKLSDTTDYLVWPETSIQWDMWLDKLKYEKPVRDLKQIMDQYSQLTIITGISGFERYENKSSASVTAREIINKNSTDTLRYDIYNTALQIDSTYKLPYYHKSKLVPGVERMPYPKALAILDKISLDLGGISGSLGIQKERTVFFNHDSIGVAPVICYESIFGEYVADYIKNGANLIFIITNDDWWDNTAGYRQHCLYGKLRSIETRRAIARSANTGISCFIDQRGDIYQATKYREDAVINQTILANEEKTFYVNHGDYIARIALWISGILLILSFISFRLTMQNGTN